MSGHMKAHPTNNCKVIIIVHGKEKVSYIPENKVKNLEEFLDKYSNSKDDSLVAWEELARDRIEKYKKAGLVLRGMRYRENMSQIALAKKSGLTQNEISNIENGKRTVGEKIAKKLAKALNFDYRLLIEVD